MLHLWIRKFQAGKLKKLEKLRSTKSAIFQKKGKKAFKGFFPFDQVVQSLDCLCQKITTSSA